MKTIDDYSGYGNKVLYQMCKKAPTHTDVDEIHGKLWIIGRSYSASIERGAGKNIVKGEDFIKTKVAQALKKSDIDSWLKSVSSITRLNKENIELSLACHKNLTDLFKKITGKNNRSLASKYLHFHQPLAFFIYDSQANNNIRARLRESYDKKKRLSYPKEYDNEYASFSTRCLYYRDHYLEKKIHGLATPRKLDMELLGY